MFGIPVIKLVMYGVAALAAMIVLGMIYRAIGNHFTAPLKAELKASQQATEVATSANAQLVRDLADTKAAYAEQAKAVSDLQGESDARLKASQSALAAAKARSASMQATVDQLHMISLAPSKTGDPDVDKVLTDLAVERVRYNGSTGVVGPGLGGKSTSDGSLRIH